MRTFPLRPCRSCPDERARTTNYGLPRMTPTSSKARDIFVALIIAGGIVALLLG